MCPKCKTIIPQTMKYCPDCQKKVDEYLEQKRQGYKSKANKKYDEKRNKKYVIFYQSSEWKILRAVKLSEAGYLCEDCKEKGGITAADQVHHMESIEDNWDRRMDITNLRCLCNKCHNERHNRWGVHKKVHR